MPKPLSKNWKQWLQIESLVKAQIEIICDDDTGRDDTGRAAAFLQILDYVTSEQYEQSDRQGIARAAKKHAFTFTKDFQKALEASLRRAA